MTAKTLVKRSAWVAVGALTVAALVWAMAPKPIAVETTTVSEGPLEVAIEEDGRTRIRDRYVISAPLAGSLTRVELHPGDSVTEGQVLVRIVPMAAPLLDERSQAEARARVAAAESARKQALTQIERAKGALSLAESEAQRQRKLVPVEGVAQETLERTLVEVGTRKQEVAAANFGARVAQAELAVALSALGHVEGRRPRGDATSSFDVKAPTNGLVLRVLRESEGVVQAGQPIIEVGDPQALEIVVDVLTQQAVHVAPGQRVSIERWGGDTPLQGHVRLVEPSAFTEVSALGIAEQRVNVLIDLDAADAQQARLGDGYRVEARIITSQAARVLKVPEGALFRDKERWAVYAAERGRAALRYVTLGRRNGIDAEVTEGLHGHERVILHPSDRIISGTRVE